MYFCIMEKKVIALIRTSTVQQEVDSQKEEVLDMVKADGYSIDEVEIVGGRGASAIKLDEEYLKNLNRVYELINSTPTIKAVYAWSIDRIGRNEVVLFQLKNFLIEKSVQLIVKNPSLRLLEADGSVNTGVELAFSLFATMAKQEMQQKRARFNRAKKRNAEAGRANGGSKNIPFGYSKDEKGYFVINEEEADIVRLLFELHNSGKYSLNKLALELNERGYLHRGKKFTNFFLRMFIKSTVVVGYSDVYKEETNWSVRRIYPQIISKEQHDLAQQVLRKNQMATYKGTKHYYFGAKLLYCEECNHYYATDGKQYRSKLHSTKITKQQQGLPFCENNKTITVAVLDGVLWSIAREKHLNFLLKEKDITAGRNQKQIKINLQKITSYERIIAKSDVKRAKVIDDFYSDRITEKERERYLTKFTKDKSEAENAIANLNNENQALQRQLDSLAELSYNSIQKLTASLAVMNNEKEMYELVHTYIKKAILQRSIIDGKYCMIITIYFYDGAFDTIYFFSKNRKHALYKKEKTDISKKYIFTDIDGNTYYPYFSDKIKRDKDGKVILPEISSIQITDGTASDIFIQELLKQSEEMIAHQAEPPKD